MIQLDADAAGFFKGAGGPGFGFEFASEIFFSNALVSTLEILYAGFAGSLGSSFFINQSGSFFSKGGGSVLVLEGSGPGLIY